MFFEKPSNSAQGMLALLNEPLPEVKTYALHKLLTIVDTCWPEIADSIKEVDALCSDPNFSENKLASILASKIFYHLQEYDEALNFALQAGDHFDVLQASQDEFTRTMLSKCIDEFIAKNKQNYEAKSEAERIQIHPRLEGIIEDLFLRCFAEGTIEQAVGIAIDSRRLDKLKEAILKSADLYNSLKATYELAQKTIKNKGFRLQVIRLLYLIYNEQCKDDFFTLSKCQFFLRQPEDTANLLKELLNGDDRKVLAAYQIAVDLLENQNQQFLQDVRNLIIQADDKSEEYNSRVGRLQKLLTGETVYYFQQTFLKEFNKTDKLILSEKLVKNVDAKLSIQHNEVIWAAAMMHAGTQDQSFFKTNFEWIAKATNWSKFQATASIGAIHFGNPKVQEIVKEYMPGGAKGTSPYTNGGAFYALGLAHANRYDDTVAESLLLQIPNQGQKESPLHGISLGLGLVALATGKANIYEELKNLLYTDIAPVGEAAAWGMGMVMAGSGDKTAIEEMITYASETQHDKIIRALGIGLALVMYGREEEADALVDQLYSSQDSILRFGAMYVVGMAYAGTSNNAALRKLLHVTVSDVDSDVRRAAITNIGFLLFKTPEKLPRMIAHLTESYNPYIRQGTAMALGIACAGTCNKEAMILLSRLRNDFEDIVRQAAFIASALVTMQSNKTIEGFGWDLIQKHLALKHESPLTRMGVIAACGIMNAGGRNCTVRLAARSGHNRMAAIVGMALFAQFWYWFPLQHCLSLALTPASLIALDSELRAPTKFEFVSKAKPSEYGYPKPLELESDKPKELGPAAVLSAANRAKVRKKEKEAKEGEGSQTPSVMGTEDQKNEEGEKKDEAPKDENNQEGEEKKEEEKKEDKKEEEPDFLELNNPARVLPQQESVIEWKEDSRYVPVVKGRASGFIFVEDRTPDEPAEYFGEIEAPPAEAPAQEASGEMEPPAPFELQDNE